MTYVESEILGYLQTGLTTSIKTYYQGEVIAPPQSYLPCLMVFGTGSEIKAKDTLKDQITYHITVRIIVSLANYLKDTGVSDGVIKTQKALRDLMEGRESNGTYTPATVAGVMRNKAKLRGQFYYYDGNLRTQYKTIQSGEYFYVAADMTFDAVTDVISRPGY